MFQVIQAYLLIMLLISIYISFFLLNSGAWLGTVKHLLDNPLFERKFYNESISKSEKVRCEDASFYFFHHMFEVNYDPNPGWGTSPVQTIDLLDFSGVTDIIKRHEFLTGNVVHSACS